MELSKIKPKVKGTSDKYSWGLYRFLLKLTKDKDEGKYIQRQLKIFWITRSKWDSSYLPFDKTKPLSDMQLAISPLGGKTGYFMSNVFGRGQKLYYTFSVYKNEELIDITDWFFSEYERIGRCIFFNHDRNWLVGGEERYTEVGNTRKCNWCGKWQQKEIVVEKIVKRTEVWS